MTTTVPEPTVVLPTPLPVAQAHLEELRSEAERERFARSARATRRASWLASVQIALRDRLARSYSIGRHEPCPTC